MVREDKSSWKAGYFLKLVKLLDEYPKCFIVGADNVGSKQMQEIRIALRGKAVVLMGKNTMMRKAIRGHLEKNPDLERILPHIKNNVGFVFTKEELTVVRLGFFHFCLSMKFKTKLAVASSVSDPHLLFCGSGSWSLPVLFSIRIRMRGGSNFTC